MELSEAIRLGAMTRPQAFGEVFDKEKGTCALGAAVEAAGCLISLRMSDGSPGLRGQSVPAGSLTYSVQTPEAWRLLLTSVIPCPICEVFWPGHQIITHLNDDHRWTREAIADFVESIERATAPAAAEAIAKAEH